MDMAAITATVLQVPESPLQIWNTNGSAFTKLSNGLAALAANAILTILFFLSTEQWSFHASKLPSCLIFLNTALNLSSPS